MRDELLGKEFCAFDAGRVVVGNDGYNARTNAADQSAKMGRAGLTRRTAYGEVGGWGMGLAGTEAREIRTRDGRRGGNNKRTTTREKRKRSGGVGWAFDDYQLFR